METETIELESLVDFFENIVSQMSLPMGTESNIKNFASSVAQQLGVQGKKLKFVIERDKQEGDITDFYIGYKDPFDEDDSVKRVTEESEAYQTGGFTPGGIDPTKSVEAQKKAERMNKARNTEG